MNNDTEKVGANEDPGIQIRAQHGVLDSFLNDNPFEGDRDGCRNECGGEDEHDELDDESSVIPDGTDRGHGYTSGVAHQLEDYSNSEECRKGPCSSPYADDGRVDKSDRIKYSIKDAGPQVEEIAIGRGLDRAEGVHLITVVETRAVARIGRHCGEIDPVDTRCALIFSFDSTQHFWESAWHRVCPASGRESHVACPVPNH